MPVNEDTGEAFIRHILQPGEYDPVKAHEYYLRTRKLKGRQQAVLPPPNGTKHLLNKPVAGHKHVGLPKKSAEQHRKEIEQKTIALQGRLEHLKKVLAQLVAEAKRRSGVKTATKKTQTKKDTTSAASKKTQSQATKLTNQQKLEKAKKEKEAYNKAHPEAKLREVAAQVKAMEEKIAVTRAEIAAMRKQHTPVPVGAGSNRKEKTSARSGRVH